MTYRISVISVSNTRIDTLKVCLWPSPWLLCSCVLRPYAYNRNHYVIFVTNYFSTFPIQDSGRKTIIKKLNKVNKYEFICYDVSSA